MDRQRLVLHAFPVIAIALTIIGCPGHRPQQWETVDARATLPAPPPTWSDDSIRRVSGAGIGAVVDCDSVPVPGARISVQSETGELVDSAVSDAAGGFVVGPLPAGSTRLRVMYVGFETYESVVDFERGHLDTLLVQLNDAIGLIADCICPDGRSMGSQCCPPWTPRRCR